VFVTQLVQAAAKGGAGGDDDVLLGDQGILVQLLDGEAVGKVFRPCVSVERELRLAPERRSELRQELIEG